MYKNLILAVSVEDTLINSDTTKVKHLKYERTIKMMTIMVKV